MLWYRTYVLQAVALIIVLFLMLGLTDITWSHFYAVSVLEATLTADSKSRVQFYLWGTLLAYIFPPCPVPPVGRTSCVWSCSRDVGLYHVVQVPRMQ